MLLRRRYRRSKSRSRSRFRSRPRWPARPASKMTRSFLAQWLCPDHRGLQRQDGHLFCAPAGRRTFGRRPRRSCRPAPKSRWVRSRPALARSTGGRSNTFRRAKVRGCVTAGRLAERRFLSHPRGRTPDRRLPAHRLSAHGAGLDHPAADEDGARRRRRRRDRRLRQAIPGAARSGAADRLRSFLRPDRRARSRPTTSAAAPTTSSATARATSCAPAGASKAWREIEDIVVATRGAVPGAHQDVAA